MPSHGASSRELPSRPNLDHLRHEARSLHRAVQAGDARASERVRDTIGDRTPFKLTDAQRVIAREYGFPTWARLRAHVQASRGFDDAVNAFLDAMEQEDAERAADLIRARPTLASESLHVAALLGDADTAARLIAEDAARVRERAGRHPAEPLFYLCLSPFHGDSAERDAGLLATATLLIDAGADPNAHGTAYNLPALYGVTGMHNALPIARLLLDAGADPTDGESVFHAAENFHEDALDMLVDAGADLNRVGDWGNTPLYFLLRYWDIGKNPRVKQGMTWLLEHGADPNVRCGTERETSLHLAARRGQDPDIVRQLLDHGADVAARRGDGSTAWRLARRGGFNDIAVLLEDSGALVESLSAIDVLLGACGRGDVEEARRLSSPALLNSLSPEDATRFPEAAAMERPESVMAYLAAGFPVDTVDAIGATALHYAALQGNAMLVRALLAAGADTTIMDNEHASTPLGWAGWGSEHIRHRDGDYDACIRALREAGA